MKKLLSIGAAVAVSATLAANAEASEHKVEAGETLSAIAAENSVSVKQLKESNDLSSDLIVPGQILNVGEEAPSPEVDNDNKEEKAEADGGVYVIEAGDTLSIIADKFNVSVNDIRSWNNLSSDLIFSGKEIVVSKEAVSEDIVEEAAPQQDNEVEETPAAAAAENQNNEQEAAPEKVQPKTENQSTQPASNSGQNWGALAACESGGNPGVVSANGLYHGLYQFDVQTWRSVGGSGLPSQASAAEQTKRAEILYSQRGAQPWPVCGQRL
ncbi:LysM peptidoglycan-binding domain-containing protein [Corticicoccus populi]|uniref:LysM peptidoglycan-binding domain-containing protein n=1 Tax=Corticicoccus populi TaxID=1812821 RepID=A0ABW5WWK5_9STAP